MRIVSAWLALVWVLTGAYGGEVTPLFGAVTGVAADDVLNVRARPHYRATKVGALPPDAQVGVDRCRKKGHTRWCRIHHLAQYNYPQYGDEAPEGWVNARFLTFGYRGYVLIDGKGRCDYALSCRGEACDVVTGLQTDTHNRVVGLEHRHIARSRLRGASHFSAAADTGGDGYCTSHRDIADFLARQKLAQTQKQWHDPALNVAVAAIDAISDRNITALAQHIHPDRGVVLSDLPHFARGFPHFDRASLIEASSKSSNRYLWGYTPGRGKPIRKSLLNYFDDLMPSFIGFDRVEKSSDLRGFEVGAFSRIIGYRFLWLEPYAHNKQHNWHGILVLLTPYQGAWYVVGILRDYWTI